MHFNQCFSNQVAYVYIVQLKFIGKAQLYKFKILPSMQSPDQSAHAFHYFFVNVVMIFKRVKKIFIRHRFTYNLAVL